MATSSNNQPSYHTRSNSLPSRPHPFSLEFDEHLSRLRSSESTSTSSSSISHRLNGLQDLYDSVDKLLQLPLTQQALAREQHKKCFHQLLDGTLMPFDIYSTAKDSLSQTKECVHDRQLTLRRRWGGEFELDETKKYLTSRKVVKKALHKALRNSKGTEDSCIFSALDHADNETRAMVSKLKEVEAVTLSVFKFMLSFISGSRAQSKLSGWSVFSKLMQPKRVACEKEETGSNEFGKMDAALYSFICHKTSKSDNIQNELKDLELSIQDLEGGLESLDRHLIKARVSMLNLLNK